MTAGLLRGCGFGRGRPTSYTVRYRREPRGRLRARMHPVETFELVLVLLATVIALHWAAARVGFPPSAALLVGGGALAFVPGIPEISLDPELALVLFLPPLLMDGAYYTAFGRFRRHLPGILSLAVGAVLFTTVVVGVVARWLVPALPGPACFAWGRSSRRPTPSRPGRCSSR